MCLDKIDGQKYFFCCNLCAVSEQLSAQYGAVKMLHSRVRLLLDYLKSIQSGETGLRLVRGR
jgi:hypothetical protein